MCFAFPFVMRAVFNLVLSPHFTSTQSHVHDDARSAEGRIYHHHLLHVRMFQDKPEDERRVPHLDQVMVC
jgi:hypothetical protein